VDSAPRARDRDIIEDSLTRLQPITLAYATALLLYPLRRKRYIDMNWKKSWARAVLLKLKNL
jgi:hypothetical protein